MTVQWNTNVYTQERNIMRISEIDASASYIRVLILSSGLSGTVVKYSIPASKNLDIDFSDLVRLSATGMCSISAHNAYDVIIGNTYTMQWTQAGRINPAGVYIPPFTMPDALIVPPERILYAGLTDIRCEFYPAVTTGLTWALEGAAQWAVDKRWVDAIGDFIIYRLKSGQTTIARKSTFQTTIIDACKSPAVAVRWVSFTGVQRVHHFMLRKPTIASAENYQLLTLDNSYNEIKGRVDGLDLYLDDLLPYDLWYYADVITSSKVEVSLDGQTWNQVQVTNKNVTIPAGEMGNGKLEITVNWKRYDPVTVE